MHCSDEELLAHLDGELPFWRKRTVRRHLESCWPCRGRASSFETQIEQLTSQAEGWSFPESDWMAGQRTRLSRRMHQFDASRRWVRSAYSIPVTASVAIGLAVTIILLLPRHTPPAAMLPAEAISRVEKAERAMYLRPVEQVFAVRITQTFPAASSTDSQLQVWSDQSTRRFASKWTGGEGRLKHALWQPAANTEFVYKPTVAGPALRAARHQANAPPLVSVADDGLDPGRLEKGFMRWMEDRSWAPVAFTPDLSLWVGHEGASATAETIRDSGDTFVRITARKRMRAFTAILTVEVDPHTWRPRRQAIRFESTERVVELRLTSSRTRSVASEDLSEAVLRPDLSGVANPPSSTVTPTLSESEPRLPADAAVAAFSENTAHAVEAQYVLHEAGACLGDPVEIAEEPEGVRVRTLRAPSAKTGVFSANASLQDVTGALADLRRPAPVRWEEADTRVPADALRNAWALRQLAVDFPLDGVAALPERAKRLLESMLHDHISNIRAHLGGSAPLTRDMVSDAGDWRVTASGMFDSMLRIREGRVDETASFDELNRMLDEIAAGIAKSKSLKASR